MRGESAGPSGRSAAAADPWAAALASLHRNVSQFGENLGRLQHTLSSQMAQLGQPHRRRTAVAALPVASVSQAAVGGAAAAAPAASWSGGGGGGVSKEEIGRATWTFLHTLAAQYPNHPTRQQKRDARNLIDILTRMYPCGECARHWREVVRASPPALASRADFSRWMCEAHNVVNRRLGKPTFNCALAEARWAGVACEVDEEGREACSLEVGRRR